jgi:cytochrome c-type biogenesis protein CcmE
MRAKYTYIIVGALVVVSIILAYDASTSYISPYLSVSEIAKNSATYIHKEVQVLGTVVNGSSGWGENDSFLFNLTDGQYTIEVTYNGNLPSGFNEGQQVVVIGNLVSPYNLSASEMLVKCPSKYEGGETSLLTDPVFLIAIVLGSAALIYYVALIFLKKS